MGSRIECWPCDHSCHSYGGSTLLALVFGWMGHIGKALAEAEVALELLVREVRNVVWLCVVVARCMTAVAVGVFPCCGMQPGFGEESFLPGSVHWRIKRRPL